MKQQVIFQILIYYSLAPLFLFSCSVGEMGRNQQLEAKNDDAIISQILQQEGCENARVTVYKKNNRIIHLSIREVILPELPPLLSQLDSLKSLSLAGNGIQDISSVDKCLSLVDLYLEGNQITTLPSIAHLNHLKFLTLASNEMEGVFDCELLPVSLEKLSIGSNQLSSVKHVDKLMNLQKFFFSWNELQAFPQNMCSLQELWKIEASGNSFDTTTVDLTCLKKLTFLDLDSAYVPYLKVPDKTHIEPYILDRR